MSEHERNDRTFSPARAERLDDPARQQSLPPAHVVAALQLNEQMTVADIGAGTGYFAVPIARAVASGRVLAVDFQDEMLDRLRYKLATVGAPVNVDVVKGEARATNIAVASCDRALIANVWHELDRRDEVLAEMRRILGNKGRLAILDWRADVEPPPGPPRAHRIPIDGVVAELEAGRWSVTRSQQVGSFSYIVVAEPL